MTGHLHERQPVRFVVIQVVHLAGMPAFIPVKLKVRHHKRREAVREFRGKLRVASLIMMQKELLQGLAVFFGSRTCRPLIFCIKGSIASSSTE